MISLNLLLIECIKRDMKYETTNEWGLPRAKEGLVQMHAFEPVLNFTQSDIQQLQLQDDTLKEVWSLGNMSAAQVRILLQRTINFVQMVGATGP